MNYIKIFVTKIIITRNLSSSIDANLLHYNSSNIESGYVEIVLVLCRDVADIMVFPVSLSINKVYVVDNVRVGASFTAAVKITALVNGGGEGVNRGGK